MSGPRNRYGRRPSHRQYQIQPHSPSHNNLETRGNFDSAKISRVNSLLSRIRDESDPVYTRRLSYVNQFVVILNEPCTPWEKSQIFEAVTRGTGFEAIFEDSRAPTNFKTAVTKCLAQTALLMNNDINNYFRWIFERLQASDSSSKEREKERKLWLLTSLREVFVRNQFASSSQTISSSGPLQQFIPNVLHDLESLLDSMDSSDCFPGILEVLEKIAERYPTEFGERFQDIIDLLVGWYIDISVSDTLHSLIADTFKRLRSFWGKNLKFAYELLSHFLADMEVLSGVTVSQEGPQIDDRTRSESEAMPSNLKALLSCFQAIAEAIGPILQQTSVEEINNAADVESAHPFDQLRVWIIKFIFVIAELYMDTGWFEKGCQIILTMSSSRKKSFVQYQVQSTKFWLLQIQNGLQKESIDYVIDDWFDGFLQILSQWTPYIHPDVIIILANPNSSLMKLRLYNPYFARLHSDILDMFRILLKNQDHNFTSSEENKISLIQQITIEVGQMISFIFSLNNLPKIDMQSLSKNNVMINSVHEEQMLDLFPEGLKPLFNVTDLPTSTHILNERTATFVIVFDIELIIQLLPVLGHDREIFWILYFMLNKFRECDYFDGILMCSLINALRHTCKSKHYFIEGEQSDSAFHAMSFLINSLLQNQLELSFNIFTLIIEWVSDVLKFCNTHEFTSTDIKNNIRQEFEHVICTLIAMSRSVKNNNIRIQIPKVIHEYFDVFGSLSISKKAFSKIIQRINDVDHRVRSGYSKLIYRINPFFATFLHDDLEDQIVMKFKANVCMTPNLGSFRSPHFQIVMNHLGMKELLTGQDETDNVTYDPSEKGQWRLRLFLSCQSNDLFNPKDVIEDNNLKYVYSRDEIVYAIVNSNDLLTFWTLWEVARYCVLSRLRTPFGGPKQTFDAFEKRLNDLLIEDFTISIKNELDDDNLHYSMVNRYQLRDLLNLFDRLELQIYNATVGTSLGNLPQAPRASIVFFRTNRKVCDDWFSRIRTGIVKGAKIIGDDALAVMHGFRALAQRVAIINQGLITNENIWLTDFQQILTDVVECLQRLHAGDSIIGLLAWSKRVCPSDEKQETGLSDHTDDFAAGENIEPAGSTRRASTQISQHEPISNQANFNWMQDSNLFAESRYELAANEAIDSFDYFLEIDSEMQPILPQARFLNSQIIDCYCMMQDLSSLAQWVHAHDETEIIIDPLVQINQDYLTALAKYHDGDYLDAWKLIDNVPPQISQKYLNYRGANFIPMLFLFREKLFNLVNENSNSRTLNQQTALCVLENIIKHSFTDSLMNTIPLLLRTITIKSEAQQLHHFVSEFVEYINYNQKFPFSDSFVLDLSVWSPLNTAIDQLLSNPEIETTLKEINIFKFMMAKIARKSSALNYATYIFDHWKQDTPTEVVFEHSKTLFAQGLYQEAITRACSLLRDEQHPSFAFSETLIFRQNVLLKLAKWLQHPESQLNNETLSDLNLIFGEYIDSQGSEEKNLEPSLINSKLVEACLSKAINGESSTPKAWLAYASYHYQHGRQIIDELSSCKLSIDLLNSASKKIQQVLTNDWKISNGNNLTDYDIIIKNIFRMFLRRVSSLSRLDQIGDNSDNMLDFNAILPWISQNSVDEITNALSKIQKELFIVYKSAVDGYFRFLQSAHGRNDVQNAQTQIRIERIEESDIITATLRILRLLVKHGPLFEESFVEGFNNTNIRLWENITPQLFSRLDHPEPFVQQQLCKLLCSIASISPQLVVYHTVAASNSSGTSDLSKQLLKRIADSLDNSNGTLIVEIRRVIEELQRITVLWEELWLNKISGLQLDVNRRFHKFEREFERINDNLNLSSEQRNKILKESYDAIMKPVILSIDRLYNCTIAVASTQHEKWFCQTFGNRIHEALEILRTPFSWESYKSGWDLLRNVHKDLTKELMSNRSLKLVDVSPFLGTIKSSAIAMPGLPYHTDIVTIQSFDENFIILPTKTKPKKLVLLGSDGQQYGYLFKGHEDLHLDERIMQLLQITNDLLKRDKQTRARNLRARNYAVIPLGNHSGMIQLVENATQIFVLYKKWQHREHFAKVLQNNTEELAGNPQRPSDMYFEKIGKALKKEGWPASTSRRNWPRSVLKSVFLELVSETPSDLLEKEVWASCSSPKEWWIKSTSLSRSLAVMSVIGYIIGLGDRHLDNILIDFECGEVIHIDYNVCFEKGKKLRVPETIPFRLTQNIENVLGVTGVEGVFRIACENVLRVLRENKEILITLLEAFVYDPLVDWHQNMSEDREKQILEIEENIGLLISRIAELRVPLENNQGHLSNLLSEFLTIFKRICEHYMNLYNKQVELSEQPSQSHNKIEIRDPAFIHNQVELESLKSALSQRANECALWHAQHEKTIQSIQGPTLQIIYNEIFSSGSQIGASIFTPFLQVLATNEFILQRCSKIEQEFLSWMNERNVAFKNCLERLQFYRTLVIPLVPVLMMQDYYSKWPQLLVSLLESSFSSQDFQSLYQKSNLPIVSGNALNHIRDDLKISYTNAVQESVSFAEALTLATDNMAMNESTLHSMLNNIFNEQNSTSLNSRLLYLASILSSLSELHQFLKESNDIFDVFNHVGFSANFQTVVKETLSNETLDRSSFLTYVVILLSIYHHVQMITVKITDDEILRRTLAISTELLQSVRIILSLQHNFVNVILPKIFLLIHGSPKAFEPFTEILRSLSTDTFNYWGMKHPESHYMAKSISESFKRLCEHTYREGVSQAVHLLIVEFDELFNSLGDTLLKIQALFKELKEHSTSEDGQEDLIEDHFIDNFTVHKLSVIVCVLLACDDYYKENGQPRLNTVWVSSMAMADAFKNSSDSLTRLWEVSRWWISEFFIPCIKTLYTTAIDHIGSLVRTDNDDIRLTFDSSSLINNLIAQGFVSNDDICAQKLNVKQYSFHGCKMNFITMINLQKTQVEIELQHRQMEMMRFEWINEALIGDNSLVRQQFLQNLTQDVNRFVLLENLLQELVSQYRVINAEVADFIATQIINENAGELLRSFGDAVANQQMIFAQEFERMKHVVSLCNSILHLETFRTVTDKTVAMDADTLQLVKRLESAMQGSSKLSIVGSQLDVTQQLSSLKMDESLDMDLHGNLENIAKDLRTVVEEARNLMSELFPLIDPIANFEMDTTDDSGKDARLKAKEFVREWSKFDSDFDTVISGALAAVDRRFHQKNNFSESEYPVMVENLRRDNERAISYLTDIIVRVFENLFALGEISGTIIRHNSSQKITPENIESKNSNACDFAQINTGAEDIQILNPLEANNKRDNSEIEEYEQNEPYNNPISSTCNDKSNGPSKNTITGQVLFPSNEETVENWDVPMQQAQARNAFAVGIIRRIKAKLEGKDFEYTTKMTVQEQIDKIIQQSLDIDNLCVMYEGWTPWI
ncbi:Serine/threonine-protein kinase SMG1 [Gigaspora margarita]|uniref:non-specific serine/threonine protein kinase n=1 Tax=Gigaspora margarita TaxID=4874 RepID=A0A8H4B561_GIGMA|nr:Serine/threonine-protein kinase SMG1 [Gigaspora margarita]